MDKLVQRFDYGGFRSAPTRTPQGFLQITGNLTRTGVLKYLRKDGTFQREFRPPEEVFNADSLASLAGVPVTDLHPSEMVSPGNVRSLQRGRVDEPRQDGIFITGNVVVQDQNLIEAVQDGSRREVSPGYGCRMDMTAGTSPQGERFDGVQRGIRYNHLALGPRGWARSGAEVALHLDGADDEQLVLRIDSTILRHFVEQRLSLLNKTERDLVKAVGPEFEFDFEVSSILDGFRGIKGIKKSDLSAIAKFIEQDVETLFAMVPEADRGDGNTNPQRRKKTMEPTEIRIDGINYKVDGTAAPHISKAIADRDARIETEKTRADAAEDSLKAVKVELETEKARADAASNPETISRMVNDRAAVVDKARGVLGVEAKLDGDDQVIKIACIKHTDSAFESEGKSKEYIDARFDMLSVTQPATTDAKGAAAQALASVRHDGGAGGAGGGTEDKTDAKEAQRKDQARSADAWKQPLSASKNPAPAAS